MQEHHTHRAGYAGEYHCGFSAQFLPYPIRIWGELLLNWAARNQANSLQSTVFQQNQKNPQKPLDR